MKRISVLSAVALAAAAAVLATLVVATPGRSSPALTEPWSQYFMMRSIAANGSIGVDASGSVVFAPADETSKNQRWNGVADASPNLIGAKTLVSHSSAATGMCLGVDPANPLGDNARLVVTACEYGSWPQAWLLAWDPAHRHRFHLVNYYSLKAVTVVEGKPGLVQQTLRPGAREQTFVINNCVQCG